MLDLFSLAPAPSKQGQKEAGGGARALLDSLPELWEESQYEEEYDMDTFIRGLKPA